MKLVKIEKEKVDESVWCIVTLVVVDIIRKPTGANSSFNYTTVSRSVMKAVIMIV